MNNLKTLLATLLLCSMTVATAETSEPEETVRHLFNLNTVNDDLGVIIPDQLYFSHWHGEDISLGAFRMVKHEKKGHFAGQVNRHGEEIALCTEGRFRMVIDGDTYYFGEGEMMLIPPYMPHTGECLEDACTLISWFTPHRMDEWGPENNDDPELSFLADEEPEQ